MALTKFNQLTLPTTRSNLARISLSKAGCICINKTASILLGLLDGEKLGFAQDEKGVWLIGKESDGFQVKKKDKAGTLYFSHKTLSKELNTSFGLSSDQTNMLQVLEDPKTIEKSQWFELTIAS